MTDLRYPIGPFEFDASGCVLLIEDLNTEPYLVDTAINHLRQAGKLDDIAGLGGQVPAVLHRTDEQQDVGEDVCDHQNEQRRNGSCLSNVRPPAE